MDFRYFLLWLAMGICLIVATGWNDCVAQEDSYDLAHTDIFGNLRRPPVIFAHDIHSNSLVDEGCGVCHHGVDQNTGRLLYREGEELTCKECHAAQQSEGQLALREAYHGSCTACHRRLIQKNIKKTGPTTCGGCHKKP
jgi:predicted CXXCH cytochrome family protein